MINHFVLIFLFYDFSNWVIQFESVKVWTLSLPMTVAVHGCQEHEGWATITWDNSFFAIDRVPFIVRGEVPWSHMAWALSKRFEYQTGCTVTGEHLQYLCKYHITHD